jgi:glutamate-1-semialdehyde aminotransferase
MAYDLNSRTQSAMAQGCTGTNSKRPSQYTSAHPTHIVRGEDCYIWDDKGNRYIDFVCSLGANILGHQNQKVDEAVRGQIRQGVLFSMPTPLELEVAEMIANLVPSIQKVRFLKTGSEACAAALRFARAYTKQPFVESLGYHGWHDEFTALTEPAAGVPRAAGFVNNENFPPGIVILEPAHLNINESIRKEVYDITKDRITIFDEIITGFRVPDFTISKMWSMTPDITCLGKCIANGYPLALIGGRKEVMDNPDVFVSSTYSGEAISLAACKATINEIKTRSLKDLFFYANKFKDDFNNLTQDIGVKLQGYGTRGMFDVTHTNTALLLQEAAKAGIFFGKAFFYSFAHMEKGVDEYVLNCIADIVTKIRLSSVKIEGDRPVETFVR